MFERPGCVRLFVDIRRLGDLVDLGQALEFASKRSSAVLTTLRSDGRPQQSVIFYWFHDGVISISVTTSRAKTANLRRDPRAALFIAGDSPFSWVSLDGTVEVGAVAMSPDDEATDGLVAYYRAGNGEHEDWAAYRQAMIDDGRLLLTFSATGATGIVGE